MIGQLWPFMTKGAKVAAVKFLKLSETGIVIYNKGSIIPVPKSQLLVRNFKVPMSMKLALLRGMPTLTHPGTLLSLA